jgi:hypothetical protein
MSFTWGIIAVAVIASVCRPRCTHRPKKCVEVVILVRIFGAARAFHTQDYYNACAGWLALVVEQINAYRSSAAA